MGMRRDVKIDPSWAKALEDEFARPYFIELARFVRESYLDAKNNKKDIYPRPKDIFRAFSECPFDKVRVVILGQDPYHGKGQAIGLSFAVAEGIPLPPSLQNIYKEIHADIGVDPLASGDLTRWARQGVLLLNATLTVQSGVPGSHQKKGWEEFTDAAIRALSERREHVVFILWGNYAKQKGAHIDRSKHFVIESPHPSPFSAHSGFFGSKPFSKTNTYLRDHGIPEIDWR